MYRVPGNRSALHLLTVIQNLENIWLNMLMRLGAGPPVKTAATARRVPAQRRGAANLRSPVITQ